MLNNSAAGMSALRGSQSEYLSSVHSRPGMLASVNVHPWPLIIIESLGRSMILIVLNSSSSRANKLIIDHPLKQSNHYIATTDSLSWLSPLPATYQCALKEVIIVFINFVSTNIKNFLKATSSVCVWAGGRPPQDNAVSKNWHQ